MTDAKCECCGQSVRIDGDTTKHYVGTEREKAIEECASLIESKSELYTTDIFSEPKEGSPIDCYSAKMGRHCSKVWSAEIRSLLEKDDA